MLEDDSGCDKHTRTWIQETTRLSVFVLCLTFRPFLARCCLIGFQHEKWQFQQAFWNMFMSLLRWWPLWPACHCSKSNLHSEMGEHKLYGNELCSLFYFVQKNGRLSLSWISTMQSHQSLMQLLIWPLMRIKRRVERDLAVMRKLEVPPQETAFILITSDKDSLTANREWKEIDALK